jgi:hypothetical protein
MNEAVLKHFQTAISQALAYDDSIKHITDCLVEAAKRNLIMPSDLRKAIERTETE